MRHRSPPPPSTVSDVPSPCTNVCRMNPALGWCSGCWRTIAEIASWSTLSDDDKRRVWAELPARRAAHAPETGDHEPLRRVRPSTSR